MKLKLPQNKRTNLAVKNIGVSIVIKGGSILISFLLVPMTLGYLNSYEYGVWLTLNSVLSWVYLFDIGLGNGLRNKLTEALASKDYELCKTYISTTFFFMAVIGLCFYGLFSIAQSFLNWYDILNVEPETIVHLNSIVTVVFAFVISNFIFKTIGIIFVANQYPAANDFIGFCGSVLSLIIIFILTKTTVGNLQWVAYTFSGVSVVVYLIAIPITFSIFKHLRPGIKYIKLKYWKSLMGLGIKFFIIQIAVVVIFMTSNIIISNLFGPEEVTPYNIAFKLFSVVTLGFNIILAPFWSAITDAMSRNDYTWIKNITKRLLAIWGLSTLGVTILIIISPFIYKIWIGNEVTIPFMLSVLMGIYIIINIGASIFSNIINGFGKLKLQLIFAIIQAVIFIPLAITLGKILGVFGIVIALIITVALAYIWGPIQTYKLISEKAKGIWDR